MSSLRSQRGTAVSERGTDHRSQHGAGLPSVRREYKVGSAAYFDPIYGITRFVGVPATSYRCPYCGHLLHADFWSGNIRLGPGVQHCVQCGELYDDGTREWPQLTTGKKLRFCCPPILAGIAGGMALAAFAVLFLPQPDWWMTVFGLILAFVPMFLFFLFRLPSVLLSIHRYNGPSSPLQ
jgi:hypothetical protein